MLISQNLDRLPAGFTSYLEVFQVCDSTFPIGSFNHSFGMENYLADGRIKKSPDFRLWLKNYFATQFKYGEGLLVLLAYRALQIQETDCAFEMILDYDRIMTQSTLAAETRNGTRLITQQMLNLLRSLYEDTLPFLRNYQVAIKEEQAWGNPAIIFAFFAHHKGLSQSDAFAMYGYSLASTLIQNAVRAVPLGQKDGQLILHDLIDHLEQLYEQVQQLDVQFLGANVPGLELAQIRHETQESRLFMS